MALNRFIQLMALVILSILLFWGGPAYNSSLHFKQIWNLGHIVYFALLAYYIFSRPRFLSHPFKLQCVWAIAMALILGALVEWIQASFHRTPDLADLYRNLIGAMVGLFFLLPTRQTLRRSILRILQMATIAFVGLQIYPIIVAYADEYLACAQFPILSDFETPFELQRWSGKAEFAYDAKVHLNGKYAMRVNLGTDLYSGVNLIHFPGSWQGARQFQISVHNPSNEILPLTCRIHDQKHIEGVQRFKDRFNRNYSLSQGWHTLTIDMEDIEHAPKSRRMDLNHIKGIGIFATRLPHPRIIHIDDVRLVF